MDIFIVRRPFKTCGHAYAHGDIIDNPEEIKMFKTKCNEKKIIPLPKGKLELVQLADYFRERYSIDILAKVDEFIKAKQHVKAPVQAASESQAQNHTGTTRKVVQPVVKTTK